MPPLARVPRAVSPKGVLTRAARVARARGRHTLLAHAVSAGCELMQHGCRRVNERPSFCPRRMASPQRRCSVAPNSGGGEFRSTGACSDLRLYSCGHVQLSWVRGSCVWPSPSVAVPVRAELREPIERNRPLEREIRESVRVASAWNSMPRQCQAAHTAATRRMSGTALESSAG